MHGVTHVAGSVCHPCARSVRGLLRCAVFGCLRSRSARTWGSFASPLNDSLESKSSENRRVVAGLMPEKGYRPRTGGVVSKPGRRVPTTFERKKRGDPKGPAALKRKGRVEQTGGSVASQRSPLLPEGEGATAGGEAPRRYRARKTATWRYSPSRWPGVMGWSGAAPSMATRVHWPRAVAMTRSRWSRPRWWLQLHRTR